MEELGNQMGALQSQMAELTVKEDTCEQVMKQLDELNIEGTYANVDEHHDDADVEEVGGIEEEEEKGTDASIS